MSISQLADAAGISRRAVRFYVQRGLLPAPLGRGRGDHYDQAHLDRLEQIRQLQQTGYSLDAVGRLLAGEAVVAPDSRPRPAAATEPWARLRIAEGVELHLQVGRADLDAQQYSQIRRAVRQIMGIDNGKEPDDTES